MAIIDTSCRGCVIGADTLEEHQIKLQKQAEEVRWHDDPSLVTISCGTWTKHRSLGVIGLPCVLGGTHLWDKMRVVPGKVFCLLSKDSLKEDGAIIDMQADELRHAQQQITAPMPAGESDHYKLELVGSDQGFGVGRTGTLRSTPRTTPASPVTPSRVPVTCWKHMAPSCGHSLPRDP